MAEPWTERALLEAAARGLGKIDLWGERGLTMVSLREIEAMAALLAALGVVPVAPGAPAPGTLLVPMGDPR